MPKYIYPLLFLLLPALSVHAQRTGKDYAVFFYVAKFQPGWQGLPDTEAEARNLAAVLKDEYGFAETKVVPNPTRRQILDELAAWNQRLQADDQVLFFFSMHGYYDQASDLGYLVAADGLYRDEYFSTWLDYNSLRPYFARCKAKHVLVALDACYSGSFGKIERTPEIPVYDETTDCQTQLKASFRYQVRQYLCAGSRSAKTPGKSLFADKLLETLRRGHSDADGILHFDDISYALGKVRDPEPVHGSFSGHEAGGDFVFVRKNACAPPASNDRDGDGVPNAEDQCPDVYGLKAYAGCPKPPDNDPNADADYDGIPNNRDACPDQFGTAKASGCPDRDNDGVPNISDKCPDQPGETHWQGCPDTDGDGLPDHEDQCPTQRGLSSDKGCPPPDRDKDGIPDKADKCPDQAGVAHREGCPEPDTDPFGMVRIKGGTFTMGCTSEQQDCYDDEKPTRRVTLSDFYMGKYEVTQRQWQEIMGENPSNFNDCPDCPVEQVSWDDIQTFLQKLNVRYPGRNYRLPTEAEWEYAAREGGKAVLFGNGKNIIDPAEANFDARADYKKPYSVAGEYRQKTTPVGSFRPNALGLYDMAGNVWEWCSDWKGAYPSEAQTNPQGPASGSNRVLRGGSWYLYPRNCRVALRYSDAPDFRSYNIGFRLSRTP